MKNQVTENPVKNRVNSIGVTHVAGQVKDMPLHSGGCIFDYALYRVKRDGGKGNINRRFGVV